MSLHVGPCPQESVPNDYIAVLRSVDNESLVGIYGPNRRVSVGLIAGECKIAAQVSCWEKIPFLASVVPGG